MAKNKPEIILILSLACMLWALRIISLEIVFLGCRESWQLIGWVSVAIAIAISALGLVKSRIKISNHRLWLLAAPVMLFSSLLCAELFFILPSVMSDPAGIL